MKTHPELPRVEGGAVKPVRGGKIALLHPKGFAREILQQALETRLGAALVVSEDNFDAFLSACQPTPPDVAIVDEGTIDGSRGDSLRKLRDACPQVQVLVLGHSGCRIPIQRAIDAGAKGFIDRGCPLETLLEAIRATTDGANYLCRLSQDMLRRNKPRTTNGFQCDDLSRRELEVLRAIAEGKMTKQIAQEQGRSIYTIENQRRRILRKTGFSSVAQITLLALELGLIDRYAH